MTKKKLGRGGRACLKEQDCGDKQYETAKAL